MVRSGAGWAGLEASVEHHLHEWPPTARFRRELRSGNANILDRLVRDQHWEVTRPLPSADVGPTLLKMELVFATKICARAPISSATSSSFVTRVDLFSMRMFARKLTLDTNKPKRTKNPNTSWFRHIE